MTRPSRAATAEAIRLLPAARLVPPPTRPRRVARRLALAMALFLVFVAASPWRQNISGDGNVVAYAPDERPQNIEATISGRVLRWHVLEGEAVAQGQLLVELTDNDPDRLRRYELEREANLARLVAYEDQVVAYRAREDALRASQSAQIAASEAEVQVAREKLRAERELLAAAEASAKTAGIQRGRVDGLAGDGLVSQRDRELAALGSASAEASRRSARAKVRAAESELATKEAALKRVQATTEADLQSARAALRSAETQVASTRASMAKLDSQIAQQEAQRIHAPRAGVVQRILAQQGGVQVSRGQTLASLVPDTRSRAVQLYADGNDAALVTPGREVRLQFEGWPAVQFAGWPSVAVGSFAGRVAFVDPSDDGRGDFRVLVVPDPAAEPWPEPRFLRQGTRARGWILLEEVSVGFEIWRQLNGFPPRYRTAPTLDLGGTGAAKDGAKGESGAKAKGGEGGK